MNSTLLCEYSAFHNLLLTSDLHIFRGDTFVILSRARGWWVVQRDPTGSGIVDTDIVKQGWVPAGCLLETKVPVASAIAEATAAKQGSGSPPATPSVSKTPILPLSIISTSFPGIALMDYKKKGDEELDLVKDDALRVFKRYNHWSYVSRQVEVQVSSSYTIFTGCKRSWGRSGMGTGKFTSSTPIAFIQLFGSPGSLAKSLHPESGQSRLILVFLRRHHPPRTARIIKYLPCRRHFLPFNHERRP